MRISDWSSDVCSSDLIDAMRRLHPLLLAPALLLLLLPHLAANAADRFIVVQSTTSTQNSGLFDAILPKFTGTTGIEVRDRKSVVWGKSGSVRVDLGGRRIIQKKHYE